MESRNEETFPSVIENSQVTDNLEFEDNVSEKVVEEEEPHELKKESIDQMLSRHRKEMSELRSKEMEMKKAAARGSKAEQKVKKKQVEEEISRLSSKLKAIHSKELASLGYKSNGTETNDIDKLVKAITGVSANISHSDSPKPTRSLRRKEKRIQQEAAREQRIQEEQSNIISERMIENEKLEKKLQPLGLTINEIKADGHCLYRAVEDQLSFQGNSFRHTYQELRAMVAAYMREHTTEFLPFFLSENKLETGSEDSHSEKFERYCFEVESTAAWGGQLELNALMHCLRKHIIIFSGSFPDVEMGKEYKTEGANSNPSIRLSYHKHAFGLGEHYNSVVPIPI